MERKRTVKGRKKGNKSQVGKRNVTRKEGGKDREVKNMKKRSKEKERYEPDLCNAMRIPKIVRSPFYIFAPLIRTTIPNSLIHHVCSIIGHAKSRRSKVGIKKKDIKMEKK